MNPIQSRIDIRIAIRTGAPGSFAFAWRIWNLKATGPSRFTLTFERAREPGEGVDREFAAEWNEVFFDKLIAPVRHKDTIWRLLDR